jgi:hypothetical protein
MEGSEPRDGLFKAITPSPPGAQRTSPNDSRNGSMRRASTALRESWVNDSSALQGVQRSSPNDSRNGSNSRALTALRESWVNDSRDKRSPGGAQSRRRVSAVWRRRAANQPHPTGVVPRAQFNPRGRYGATGEQKHLPDRPTPSQSSRKRLDGLKQRSLERT